MSSRTFKMIAPMGLESLMAHIEQESLNHPTPPMPPPPQAAQGWQWNPTFVLPPGTPMMP